MEKNMKFSIRQTLWGSIQFYKTHFKSFWKQFWFPMSLAFLQALAMPSATEYLHQKTINLGEFLVFSSLGFIPSWLIIRSLIPFLKGVSFSSFWGRPFDKKDWQYFLRSIVFIGITSIVSLLIIGVAFAAGILVIPSLIKNGFSMEAITLGANLIGLILGIVICIIIFQWFFYSLSAYSDRPLNLKECRKLWNKNFLRGGLSLLVLTTISGILPSICIQFGFISLYYVFVILLTALGPIASFFSVSLFLSLLQGKNFYDIKDKVISQ